MATQPTSPTKPASQSGRRTRRAVAAFLLVALLGGGAATAANAVSQPHGVPAVMAVPAPHDGDKWTYAVTLGDGWKFGADDTLRPGVEAPAFSFAWQGDDPIRLPDRFVHDAARVDTTGLHYFPLFLDGDAQAWTQGNSSAWFGPQGIVARERSGASGSASASSIGPSVPNLPPVFADTQSLQMSEVSLRFNATEPCLVRNALQGREVQLGGAIALFEPCSLGGYFVQIGLGVSFRAVGVETVSGIEAVRFDATDGSGLRAWFNPGISYPVQLHLPAAVGHVETGEATLRLTGIARAGVPLPVADSRRDQVDGLSWASPQPYGPNDAGLATEFPLSEAYGKAHDAADWSDLRDYLTAHPRGYAAGGRSTIIDHVREYGPMRQPGGVDVSWLVTLTDGASCFIFQATREARPGQYLDPLAPATTKYRFDTMEGVGKPCNYPAKAPLAWPTAASATNLWKAYASAEDLQSPVTGIAFGIDVEDGNVTPWLLAGQAANHGQATDTAFGFAMTMSGAGARLILTNGQIEGFDRISQSIRSYQAVAGVPTDSVRSAAAPQTDQAPRGLAAALLLPPAAAAGVGFFAVAAGAAAWFWPVKGAPMGLFSRLIGDRLLDHPTRRSLMALIEAEPGIHYQELLRATSGGKGGLEHHLSKLEKGGLVKAERGPRYSCYFPAGASAAIRLATPALKSDGARRVLSAIRGHPGISGVEVSSATGLGTATVSEHVARLAEAGLVEPQRNGRSIRLHATRLGQDVAIAA